MMNKILSNTQAQGFLAATKVSSGRVSVFFDKPDCEILVKVYRDGGVVVTRMSAFGNVEREEYTSLEAFEEAYTFLL